MSLIEVAREDAVCRIALNRPEKKNALSSELCVELVNAVDEAFGDREVRAVLLEARGDFFCAGMDLTEVTDGGAAVPRTNVHERLFTMLTRARKPIVAAVQGPALGGGLGLIANAHVALAAQGCTFGLTEIRVGMWPFVIWHSMVAAIGERRAMALALTGRIFSVGEALQFGLVHEVAPAFELEDRAVATAHHLAQSAPATIRLALEYVDEVRKAETESDAIQKALEFRSRAFQSPEFKEGVAALHEKRKPVWPAIG